MYYLASPYTHEDPRVVAQRYVANLGCLASLLAQGYPVFSPVVHNHNVKHLMGNNTDHDFWMKFDLTLLHKCTGLFVLTIDGWLQSKGVAKEMEVARGLGMPISYVTAGAAMSLYPPNGTNAYLLAQQDKDQGKG